MTSLSLTKVSNPNPATTTMGVILKVSIAAVTAPGTSQALGGFGGDQGDTQGYGVKLLFSLIM